MKYCPQCHKQYTEVWITFCSDDGTILIDTYAPSQQSPSPDSQRPPAPPSYEQPTWRSPDPNAPGGWVNPAERQPPVSPAWQPPQVTPAWQPPPVPAFPRQPSTGLAVASMILGIASFVLGIFCLGPVPGLAALILGLVALSQIKKAPDKNGGKPFAVIGIVTGSISLLLFGVFLIIGIIGQIMS